MTIPSKIQAKLKAGAPLASTEEDMVRAYQELEEDLPKKPEDRKRGDETANMGPKASKDTSRKRKKTLDLKDVSDERVFDDHESNK